MFDQRDFDVRCEWGDAGIDALAPLSDVVIIVDVLSFSTCVDVATGRGAFVYPYQWHDHSAEAYAREHDALLARADVRTMTDYSLSPASLMQIPGKTRLVLPSRNGSSLSMMTGTVPTLTGCLRNAKAVAEAAATFGESISVIPAGERWKSNFSLRPAAEDWIAAGAIIHHLPGGKSVEAMLAEAAFRTARKDLHGFLQMTGSGRELMSQGFEWDVEIAADLNASTVAPRLVNGVYTAM